MATEKSTLVYDGFDLLTGGMDSGIAPLSLPANKIAYGTNTTVRGGYVTHRPPYQDIALIPDTGVSLDGLRFQGACYYKPDFGAESLVAQIGGRLYQFIPDTVMSAYVYDRTARNYAGGQVFQSSSTTTDIQYSVVLQNQNDASTQPYPAGTAITSYPSFIGVSSNTISTNPEFVNNGTEIQYGNSGDPLYPFCITLPNLTAAQTLALVGKKVFLGTGNIKWNVIAANNPAVTTPNIQLQFTIAASGITLTFDAGTLVTYVTSPGSPTNLGTITTGFTPPPIGSNVTIPLSQPFGLPVGSGITIGGGTYVVIAVPAPVNLSSSVTTLTQTAANLVNFTLDPNPAGIPQAWLWQSENYVIVQDGQSRPVFFNGVSSRRANSATFVGTNSAPFVVPQIGQIVTFDIGVPYPDAIGTFISVTSLGLFPFLMEVVAISGTTITVENVTGQNTANTTIPSAAAIVSTESPAYSGVLTENVVAMPAPGGPVSLSVAPPFNGGVGDTVILTDGLGGLTSYSLLVTAINGGGSGLILQNVNAPAGLILPVGYPVISQNTVPQELPVGRMGAYVQGRNWISSPAGTSFIASDLVGDSSGSASLFYRDAVLKWSLNTTLFPVPGGAGQINCIIALAALDASLGQGPLQVLCDNDIFTCAAPADATLWPSVTSPILQESVIGFGGVGQNAAVVSNGDLILKSNDGTLHSLEMERSDFNQWGKLPISKEVNRILLQENSDLFNFITTAVCDNRCLMSCCPVDEGSGVFSQGLLALDFDVTSGLQGKLPSVYDGVWKDRNFLQLITGVFNKRLRTFAFVQDAEGNVGLTELLAQGSFDNGTEPITWGFEGPVIFQNTKGKGKFQPAKLEDAEIYVSNLAGGAQVSVWYRPDFDECWHVWTSFSFCADNLPSGTPGQYRPRVGLGKPVEDCDPSVNKNPRDGRFFQVRIEITGHCVFMGMVALASEQPQPLMPPIAINEVEPAV